MKLLLITLVVMLLSPHALAKSKCNQYQFHGKLNLTHDKKVILQVFPYDRRMYRIEVKGKKRDFYPYLKSHIQFNGKWDGKKSSPIAQISKIKIVRRSTIEKKPYKLSCKK